MKASSHLFHCTRFYITLLPLFYFRVLRPEMIDEYGFNFQQHLVDTYGKKVWADEDLKGWVEDNTRSFIAKNAFRKFLAKRGA